MESDLNITDVDWFAVGKCIAVMGPAEEIEAEGYVNFIPKEQKKQKKRITINYFRLGEGFSFFLLFLWSRKINSTPSFGTGWEFDKYNLLN
jgi:hypothetical protein